MNISKFCFGVHLYVGEMPHSPSFFEAGLSCLLPDSAVCYGVAIILSLGC